ncbi:MAG: neutral/alkaline non-lysosomal ceramidase N-terminal domain-containing protein [Phycisphaerae bacterium]|nr:neutral/alkaline non-lysosomal ceramidase N-terminal domain-containing protein [Phycisphaerae bacterium]
MRRGLVQLVLVAAFAASVGQALAEGWKAGTAKANITPRQPIWLAGYASRKHPAEGTLHPLWAKALAIEDGSGRRAVIVTADVCAFSKVMYEAMYAQIQRRYGLERSQVAITCTHTHTGPVVRESLMACYPLDEKQAALIDTYSHEIEGTIVQAVGEALDRRVPAALWAGEGTAAFAVNRRNNREAEVPRLLEQGAVLKGPVDHSLPVLAVRGEDGQLRAVLFGYACHGTVLDSYQWSGDYPGFAQLALEKNHPEAMVMFWAGCGADQNPLPRRSVALCEKYGGMLAAGVEDVLGHAMRAVRPTLRTAFEFVTLDYERNPTVAELEAMVKKEGLFGRWAKEMLGQVRAGKSFAKGYSYPVEAWRLGGEQLWVMLGGEVVVDYALRFKGTYGKGTWVTAYANDTMGYIPSRRVWEEGGYEATSLEEYGHPATRWAKDVEDRVAAGVNRVVEAVGR